MTDLIRQPMQYTETKERSAEILRAALALMGQHDAAFNPLTFAVCYEHVAGINARLSQAIQACLRTEPRLGDATIAQLYRDHATTSTRPRCSTPAASSSG